MSPNSFHTPGQVPAVNALGQVEGATRSLPRRSGCSEKSRRIQAGMRLRIDSDISVHTGSSGEKSAVMAAGIRRDFVPDPPVRKKYVGMPPPSLADQTPDLERLLAFSGMPGIDAGPGISDTYPDAVAMLRRLPSLLRSSGYRITTVSTGRKLLSVEAGDTTSRLYGTAFDIGTTTVAAYLYDLNSGKLLNAGSMMNPQRIFGADVISRIDHAKTSQQAADEMKRSIADCINGLTKQLAEETGIKTEDIYAAVFWQYRMLHFLAGLDASGIAATTFIPVTCRPVCVWAQKTSISTWNSSGLCIMPPCVSAYIGADTVSAILASGMHESDGISLLVDIGTNGEIVLGGKDGLIACSAAAGPAFEGQIRFGMGGVTGAVDSFSMPGFRYTVIEIRRQKGICGSGAVDAVAAPDAGAIDETGGLPATVKLPCCPLECKDQVQ